MSENKLLCVYFESGIMVNVYASSTKDAIVKALIELREDYGAEVFASSHVARVA